jgi:hypothetical protein
MDEFPLAVLLKEDGAITEGYLRAIGQPERVAVNHPADAALAVRLDLAGRDLRRATHVLQPASSPCLLLGSYIFHEGPIAFLPFVRVGADEHRSFLARNVALNEGKVAGIHRLVEVANLCCSTLYELAEA